MHASLELPFPSLTRNKRYLFFPRIYLLTLYLHISLLYYIFMHYTNIISLLFFFQYLLNYFIFRNFEFL